MSGTSRTYAYNADGLLQSRTQGGSTTNLLWDPATAPSRLLQVGSDKIVYGLGPLYVVTASGTTTFARDGGKSVRAELNGSGAVTASFRYKAYGAIAQSNGASTPTYLGCAGQLLDPSGLYYMRARWYDPATARFLSKDQAAPSPDAPASLNAFQYAGANPGRLFDPTGMRQAAIDGRGGCDEACMHQFAPRQKSLGERIYDVVNYIVIGNGTSTFRDDGVEVVTNAGGITGTIASYLAPAMTFSDKLIVSSHSTISDDDIDHEYGHLPQAAMFGPLYLPVYILAIPAAPLNMVYSQTVGRLTGSRQMGLADWHDAHPLEWAADMRRPQHPRNIWAGSGR